MYSKKQDPRLHGSQTGSLNFCVHIGPQRSNPICICYPYPNEFAFKGNPVYIQSQKADISKKAIKDEPRGVSERKISKDSIKTEAQSLPERYQRRASRLNWIRSHLDPIPGKRSSKIHCSVKILTWFDLKIHASDIDQFMTPQPNIFFTRFSTSISFHLHGWELSSIDVQCC